MTQISRRSRFLMTLAAGLAFSAPLHAQETALFTWSGHVDRRMELSMRGNIPATSGLSRPENAGHFRVSSALPAQDGSVRVVISNGRGEATVTQQPAANNGYQAVIILTDRSRGADRYQVTAYYTPSVAVMDPRRNSGGYGRNRMNQAPA